MMKEKAINKMIASMYTEGILSEENEERMRVYLDWMYQAGWDERGNHLVKHHNKPVIQYDLSMKVLGRYESAVVAAKELKCSKDVIYDSIWYNRPSKRGHIWKYAADEQNKDNS